MARTKEMQKNVIRLLKTLAPSRATGLQYETEGQNYILLAAQIRKTFAREIIMLALQSGLATTDGMHITISKPGISHLRRCMSDVLEFSAQHGTLEKRSVPSIPEVGVVLHNTGESPLTRLNARSGNQGKKYLDPWEFEAGERIRTDFEKAGLSPSISARAEGTVSSGSSAFGNGTENFSNQGLDAKNRLYKATDFLGPELTGVVVDVCCFLKGLELVETERQWPARSAKLMLKTGLAKLARHYGLSAVPNKNSSGKINHWGASNYRPQISRS